MVHAGRAAGIIGIIIGSTVKGMIAGIAAGWFARKVQSVRLGITFGLLVGALLAYGVAAMQHGYYFEIMLPGSIVGAIVGWATQRYGRPVRGNAAATLAAIFLVSTHRDAPRRGAGESRRRRSRNSSRWPAPGTATPWRRMARPPPSATVSPPAAPR